MMRSLRSMFVLCALIIGMLLSDATAIALPQASAPSDDLTTEAINSQLRDSLDSMGSLPWYDSDKGEVEAVPVKPRLDDSTNRDSRWIPKPKKAKPAPTANTPNQPTGGGQLPGFWSSIGTLLQTIFKSFGWILFAILIAVLVGLMVYAISKMENTASGDSEGVRVDDEELNTADKARLENLPVQVQKPTGDLLAEADRLRNTGKIDEAIIYLFGHRLVQLDRAHAIRLARGKTNRQYLNELRKRKDLHPILDATVKVFEQSYFGRYEITQEDYDRVRSLQPTFESALAVQLEAA